MKNKAKIVTLLSFSALAVVALASCGGNGGGTDKAGFYVYAVSEDEDLYDDACITYKATSEVAYNKDLVIDIKPNLYFSLLDENNSPIIPYVGLGSPTAKFNYPLVQDQAWTYEKVETTDNTEDYKLTVKGQYFTKNIIISYGDGPLISATEYLPVHCMQSDLYFTYPTPTQREPEKRSPIYPRNKGTFDRTNSHATHPLTSDVFSFNDNKSKANYANENLTFAFKAINSNPNTRNELLDLKAYEVTQAINSSNVTADPAPVSEFKYIEVIGVGKNTGDPDITLSQRTEKGPNVTVNIDEEQGMLYVNIPWSMVTRLAEAGEEEEYGITNKFKQIDFKFDPVYLNHVGKGEEEFDIIPTFDSAIIDYRAGYITEDIVSGTCPVSYLTGAKIWDCSIFRQNGAIRFGYTTGGMVTDTTHSEDVFDSACDIQYTNHRKQLARQYSTSQGREYYDMIRPGFEESAVDQEALSDRSPKSISLYSANFIYTKTSATAWPTVEILTKDVTGGTEPEKLEWGEVTSTKWRKSYYESVLRKPLTADEELQYKETKDGNWRLVLLNRPNRTIGVDGFEEATHNPYASNYDLRNKDNAYVLYSLNGTKPFEGVKTINITVK